MPAVKKLIFAPVFLLLFAILIFQIKPLLQSFDFIFSLSLETLVSLIILATLITLTALFFVLFIAISGDWRIVLAVGAVSTLLPLILLPISLGIVFAIGVAISFALTFVTLENTLKSYLTFSPSHLFSPSIKHLTSFLIIIICVTYFLSINKQIQEQGFEIPDSLIESALKISNPGVPVQGIKIAQGPNLTQEQVQLLKQNPDLLKQYGLDPGILETIPTQSTNFVKDTVKAQFENILKPYLGFIPGILSVLLFLTLQSLTALVQLFLSPLLWLIFYILEKSGFIKFTFETRQVKKLIV